MHNRSFRHEGNKTIIVGIAGSSGSGKTTLANKILNHYTEESCTIISADNYYKNQDHLSIEERDKLNFDHPDTIDFDLLANQLSCLKKGLSVTIPVYDFTSHTRKEETIRIEPKNIIIVEGILVLHPRSVLDQLDMKIFVNTDLQMCKDRRITRDINERGRTREQVLNQYATTVLPMYLEYVEPTQNLANFLIQNNSMDFSVDLKPLIESVDKVIYAPKPSEFKSTYGLGSSTLYREIIRVNSVMDTTTQDQKTHTFYSF